MKPKALEEYAGGGYRRALFFYPQNGVVKAILSSP